MPTRFAIKPNGKPAGFSWFEFCCGGRRAREEYDEEHGGGLTVRQMYVVLMSTKIGIDTLVWLESVIFFVWMFFGMVNGFAIYDGHPGPAHPVSHFGWWAFIEVFVLFLGHRATGYSLADPEAKDKFQFTILKSVQYFYFYMYAILVAFASTATHFGLSIKELALHDIPGASTAATKSFGFMIVFACMLGITMIIQLWLLGRVYVYHDHILKSSQASKKLYTMVIQPDPTTPAAEKSPKKKAAAVEESEADDDESSGDVSEDDAKDESESSASANAPLIQKSASTKKPTSLLRQVMENNNNKKNSKGD